MPSKMVLSLIATFILSASCHEGVSHNSGHSSGNPSRIISSGGTESSDSRGEILLRFKENISDEKIRDIFHRYHLSMIHRFGTSNLFLLKIEDQEGIKKKIALLRILEDVEYAEPDYRIKIESGKNKKGDRAGEILVRFQEVLKREEIEFLLKNLNLELISSFSIPNLYLLKIPQNQTPDEMIKILRSYPQVVYAEPNYSYSLQPKPQ
ncbi:MAG: hypothetical protein AB1659_08360 [Thermodesulfobacteriota bacterium]